MPNFHKDNRVYTDSLIQIAEGISDAVNRFAKGKIRFGERKKVNKARMLNALYLWFLRQSSDVQNQIVGDTMPLLLAHHEAEGRLEIGYTLPIVTALPDVDVALPGQMGGPKPLREANGRHKSKRRKTEDAPRS